MHNIIAEQKQLWLTWAQQLADGHPPDRHTAEHRVYYTRYYADKALRNQQELEHDVGAYRFWLAGHDPSDPEYQNYHNRLTGLCKTLKVYTAKASRLSKRATLYEEYEKDFNATALREQQLRLNSMPDFATYKIGYAIPIAKKSEATKFCRTTTRGRPKQWLMAAYFMGHGRDVFKDNTQVVFYFTDNSLATMFKSRFA